MPTTAADTLILHTQRQAEGGNGMGVASCYSCSSKSADVWCDRGLRGLDGCTNDRRRPAVNDRITLQGDDVQCVYGHLVTNRWTSAGGGNAAYVHLL